MAWKYNLANNLIAIGILLIIFIIIYLKIRKKTLMDFFADVRDFFSSGVKNE